jgi:tetratricopeptide (TPR) repeat protein
MRNRAIQLGTAFVCATTLLTTSLAAPSLALAQSKPDRGRARELYAQGQRLFKEGSYDAAQSAFEEALRVLPNPVVLLSIAECQSRTEHYDAAIATLEQYLRERPDAPDIVPVRQQILALQRIPAEVRVTSAPAGAELSVDGATSGKTTPYVLQMPAGDHEVAAYMPGYNRAAQTLTLHVGEKRALTFSLEPAAPPPPLATNTSTETSTYDGRPRRADPFFWSSVGVAGAAFLGGTVLGVRALKQKDVFDDRPSEKGADNGERLALFADVCFGIGAAATVTALILYLTSDDDEPKSAGTARLQLAPVADGRRLGLHGALQF